MLEEYQLLDEVVGVRLDAELVGDRDENVEAKGQGDGGAQWAWT